MRLGVPAEHSADVILGEVTAQPGWAARLAWEADHGRYHRTPAEAITELVALRLGLTMALVPAGGSPRPAPVEARASTDPRHIWQEALEAGPRRSVLAALPAPPGGPEHRDGRAPAPAAQIACCIDVRSEALRRHLEAIGEYETLGVAGFFGLPMAWRPLDGHGADASCPLVVAPAIEVGEAPRSERSRRGRPGPTRSHQRGLRCRPPGGQGRRLPLPLRRGGRVRDRPGGCRPHLRPRPGRRGPSPGGARRSTTAWRSTCRRSLSTSGPSWPPGCCGRSGSPSGSRRWWSCAATGARPRPTPTRRRCAAGPVVAATAPTTPARSWRCSPTPRSGPRSPSGAS